MDKIRLPVAHLIELMANNCGAMTRVEVFDELGYKPKTVDHALIDATIAGYIQVTSTRPSIYMLTPVGAEVLSQCRDAIDANLESLRNRSKVENRHAGGYSSNDFIEPKMNIFAADWLCRRW